jgi:hypothetical protein
MSGVGLEGILMLSRIASHSKLWFFTCYHNHSKYSSLLLRKKCRHFVLFLDKYVYTHVFMSGPEVSKVA